MAKEHVCHRGDNVCLVKVVDQVLPHASSEAEVRSPGRPDLGIV
jgi:hypothetical protein